MKFSTFMGELFSMARRDSQGNYLLRDPCVTDSAGNRLDVEELALFSVIDLLASAGSACSWLTYRDGKRHLGDDWLRYNYSPNPNQSGTAFKRMLVARMLWNNEALVVEHRGGLYIADSFQRTENGFGPNRYTGVTVGNETLTQEFEEGDVWYFRYANKQAAQLIANLKGLYSQALSEALDKYKRSGGRAGIVEVPNRPTSGKSFEGDVNKLMNERFKAFFSGKNAVVTLHEGWKFIPHDGPASQKGVSEVSDMDAIFRQAQDRACNVIHVAPGLLRGDVTGLDDAINYTLSFGLKPILRIIEAEINRKTYLDHIASGRFVRIDATHVKVVDLFSIADKVEKLLQNRVLNVNGILEKADDELLPYDWASEYTLTKNAEVVTSQGGA